MNLILPSSRADTRFVIALIFLKYHFYARVTAFGTPFPQRDKRSWAEDSHSMPVKLPGRGSVLSKFSCSFFLIVQQFTQVGD
jgi:hypothetical protein